ncbi:MAG: MFS transporter [Anaerolineae bacterium]|nr:MFS transporter [Anaerolineae bacterium]
MEQRKRNQIMVLLFFGVLMGALDIAIVGPALPAIRNEFTSINERMLAWMFSIYVLFNLIGTPLMAKLSDLYGRRWIYILDIFLFAIGSLVVALSPTFTVVLVGRAIQGFGAGGIFPVASAVIGDTFPPEKRGGALGLIGAVFGLAFIIGPILGGVILSQATWHWLFLINLPVALILIVFSFSLLPSQKQTDVPPFDWVGMLLLSGALAALAFGLGNIDTTAFFTSLLSSDVLPFLIAAVALGLALIRAEKRAAYPILKPDLFKSRQLQLGYVIAAGSGLGEASLVFLPLLAVAALGVKESQASFLLMPVVLAMAVGSPLVGRLLDKVGSKRVILVGAVVLATGMFLVSRFASGMFTFILSGALIGFGLAALLGAPVRYIMLNEVKATERSMAQGVVTVFTSIGQLVGSAVVGAVANSLGGGIPGYSASYLVIGIVSAFLIVAALGLKSRSEELNSIAV